MLEYVALNPQVQIAFLLAICILGVGYMINRRIMKAQGYEQEEKKEQRRERFMALGAPKKKPTDIEAE